MNMNTLFNRACGLFALILLIACNACKNDPPVDTSVVNVRLPAAATLLNPLISTNAYSNRVAGRIFQTLGYLDPNTYEMKPLLAKTIPETRMVTDGPYKGCSAYDFEIHEKAMWDDGSPVTAQDVIFTVKLVLLPGMDSPYHDYYDPMRSIEADPANPKKFTIYYKEYYMLSLATICQTPIYPAYHYDANKVLASTTLADLTNPAKLAELAKNPAIAGFIQTFKDKKYATGKDFVRGSGPYRLEYTDANQGAVLIKKDNWWGEGLASENPLLGAYPAKLEYKIVKEDPAVENMVRNSTLDLVDLIAPENFLRLRNDAQVQKNYEFKTMPVDYITKWMLNNRSPKLSDVRVRQALAQLVDYDFIINTALQGMGQRTVGLVPPFKTYYAKNIAPYQLNPQKASELLAAAGWKDTDGDGVVDKVIGGTKVQLTLNLLAPTSLKVGEMVANNIKETAKRGGIAINVIPSDLPKIRKDANEGNYETAIWGQGLFPGWVEAHQTHHSSNLAPSGGNTSRFVNARADSLMIAIRSTPDTSLRKQYYIQLQEVMHEQVPEIFLYNNIQRYISSKKYNHIVSGNRDGYEHLSQPQKK